MTQSEITIKTNNQERLVLDAYELTAEERTEFDYMDWDKLEAGEDSASFVRYRGWIYDLGDFQVESGLLKGRQSTFPGWHGFVSHSFFSGVLVRFTDDDHVVMGRYFC